MAVDGCLGVQTNVAKDLSTQNTFRHSVSSLAFKLKKRCCFFKFKAKWRKQQNTLSQVSFTRQLEKGMVNQESELTVKKTASLSISWPTGRVSAQPSLTFILMTNWRGLCTTQPHFHSHDPLEGSVHNPASFSFSWPTGGVCAQPSLTFNFMTHWGVSAQPSLTFILITCCDRLIKNGLCSWRKLNTDGAIACIKLCQWNVKTSPLSSVTSLCQTATSNSQTQHQNTPVH